MEVQLTAKLKYEGTIQSVATALQRLSELGEGFEISDLLVAGLGSAVDTETDGVSDRTNGMADELIDVLHFDTRTYNALKRSGVSTIGQLCEFTLEGLENIPNLGHYSLFEVVREMMRHGLRLKDPRF